MDVKNVEIFYSKQAKFYNFTRRFFLFDRKKAIKLLNIKPKDKILDFACGTGVNISLLIKNNPSGNIFGIDYSKSMLEIARKKYPKVKFIERDVSKFYFKKKFDKIISAYSITIIDDWKNAIINAKKSLNKNGKIVILDFYKWQWPIKYFYPLFKWWLLKHGVDPEKEIIPFLQKHFKIVNVYVLNSGYNFIAVVEMPFN